MLVTKACFESLGGVWLWRILAQLVLLQSEGLLLLVIHAGRGDLRVGIQIAVRASLVIIIRRVDLLVVGVVVGLEHRRPDLAHSGRQEVDGLVDGHVAWVRTQALLEHLLVNFAAQADVPVRLVATQKMLSLALAAKHLGAVSGLLTKILINSGCRLDGGLRVQRLPDSAVHLGVKAMVAQMVLQATAEVLVRAHAVEVSIVGHVPVELVRALRVRERVLLVRRPRVLGAAHLHQHRLLYVVGIQINVLLL